MKKLLRWNRRRRFVKAARILRKAAERHTKAHHMMEFTAVNESHLIMRCASCPDLYTGGRS